MLTRGVVSMWRASWLALVVLLMSFPYPTSAGPACVIMEGTGIGGVRLGMAVQAALSITGPPVSQQSTGSEAIYALRTPWALMVAEYGMVQRLSTRSPECRTARGASASATVGAVRAAYSDAGVSLSSPSPDGELLTYPTVGIRFLIRDERVLAVEVFRPELPAGRSAPVAAPTQATGDWTVRSMSARVEDTSPVTLVVEGKIENRGRPLSVYAEVHAFNYGGREAGEGSLPVYPNPVRLGGDAAFEVRVPIDDVVVRYTVTLRPMGAPTTSLAHTAGTISDFKPFGPVVARQIQAAVETPVPHDATRRDFTLAVTNGSTLVVASANVTIDIEGFCALGRETHSGTVKVVQLQPGMRAKVPLVLKDGPCPGFASWTAKTTVGSVRIGE